MSATVSKPYFLHLDGLRFVAALGFFMHSFTIRIERVAYPAWYETFSRFAQSGSLCVNLLHVLSGFLITFLLLNEEKKTGDFSILRYYVRRTVRIWPLYFLLLLIFFFVLPATANIAGLNYHETADPWAYVLFWSNFYILESGFPYSPVLAVLWTVSVEEQFYVTMPWLMKWFRKNRVLVFFLLIAVCIGFRIYYRADGRILFFHTLCIMSDFAVGALVAWAAINHHPFFEKLKSLPRRWGASVYLIMAAVIVFYHPVFDSTWATIGERLMLGIGFGYILFDQAFAEKKVMAFGNVPGFAWLGKRAYGLYCFHQVGIVAGIKFLQHLDRLERPLHYLILLPLLAFLLTVLMASVSYRFFERPFLEWKRNFS